MKALLSTETQLVGKFRMFYLITQYQKFDQGAF